MSLKLTKPQGHLLFVVLMCAMMSGALSLVLTFSRVGFSEGLISLWLKNWAIAFVVAIPVALVAVPIARRVSAAVTQ